MSEAVGWRPLAGPESRILYCSPSGRVTTPGCLALSAMKLAAAWAAASGWLDAGLGAQAQTASASARAVRTFIAGPSGWLDHVGLTQSKFKNVIYFKH